jgi:hypothetical protein
MRKTLLSLLSLFLGFSFSLRAEIVTDASVDYTTLESNPYYANPTKPGIGTEGLEYINETNVGAYSAYFYLNDLLSFNSNAIYTFTIELKGSVEGSIPMSIGSWSASASATLKVPTEWSKVTFRLTAIPECNKEAHILLWAGAYVGTIQFRNLTITHDTDTDLPLTVGNVVDGTIDYTDRTSFTNWGTVAETASLSVKNGYLEVANPDSTKENHNNQYQVLAGVPLEGGDYNITLQIQGSAKGTIHVQLGDWDNGRTDLTVPLTASDEVQTITTRYLDIPAYSSAFVLFQTGHYVGTLKIKSVTISHDDPNLAPSSYVASISDLGVATLSLPAATEIPSGVKAYVGAYDATANTLKLTQLEKVIPANTGVIIEGAADKYAFVVTEEESTATSDLLGNATADAVTITPEEGEAILVLDQVNEQLGFYNWKSGVIPAYKAYLKVKTASEAPAVRIVYGDEPGNVTGIENVRTAQSVSAPIFNLAGQRVVSRTAPGLYIQGGKKILVK